MITLDLTHAAPTAGKPRCPEGEGHLDEWFRVDQSCWGSDRHVNLSTEPTGGTETFWNEQQCPVVSLEHQADATESRVLIAVSEGAGQVLTLAEARRFALEVLALVDGPQGA